MKYYFLLFCTLFFLYNCNTTKSAHANNQAVVFESVEELQKYTTNNCRYNGFAIGTYSDEYSYEKFGLDTLQGKFIWYSNQNDKIIINTFLKEKYAVKYAYIQINKEFPKLKGTMMLTVKSKKIEEKMLAEFKRNNVESNLLISFNDELGYSSEIEISECDSSKAETILANFPEVSITYN